MHEWNWKLAKTRFCVGSFLDMQLYAIQGIDCSCFQVENKTTDKLWLGKLIDSIQKWCTYFDNRSNSRLVSVLSEIDRSEAHLCIHEKIIVDFLTKTTKIDLICILNDILLSWQIAFIRIIQMCCGDCLKFFTIFFFVDICTTGQNTWTSHNYLVCTQLFFFLVSLQCYPIDGCRCYEFQTQKT